MDPLTQEINAKAAALNAIVPVPYILFGSAAALGFGVWKHKRWALYAGVGGIAVSAYLSYLHKKAMAAASAPTTQGIGYGEVTYFPPRMVRG